MLHGLAPEKPTTTVALPPAAASNIALPEDAGRLSRLAALALALTPLVDISQVLETAGAHAATLLPHGRGYLLLWRGETRRIEYQVLVGRPVPAQLPAVTPPPARGLCAAALADSLPRLAPGLATPRASLTPWEQALIEDTDAAAALVAPLSAGPDLRGALLLTSPAELDADDLLLAAAAAHAIGGALARARAFGAAQSEKLAGMGRLTAAIAHEVNNPLQAISNSLHLLLSRSLPEEKRSRYLTLAHKEVEQLSGMVRRILDFSRPERDGMRPVVVQAALESVLTATAAQLDERQIALALHWGQGLPRVSGVASHLKQAFLTLILAAIEGMPAGGTLTVRTSLGQSSAAGDSVVVVELGDTGDRLPDEELRAIFEPFSRTRRDNSGMGLPVSYSIIEQHGGRLSVSSAEDGTVFRIELPAVRMPS